MGESLEMDDAPLHDSAPVELTAKILLTAAIVLFLVVIFVLFLHLYAKYFWGSVEDSPSAAAGQQNGGRRRHRRRRHFVFAAAAHDPARKGLDPAILRSLPAVIFGPDEFGEGLECAICLSELVDGEKARLLPKCNHWFHSDCIDMWFESHSTCPICRNPVGGESPKPAEADVEDVSSNTSSTSGAAELLEENLNNEQSSESPNFPTNVLFWGNETQVSSRNAVSSFEEPPSVGANAGASGSSSSRVEGMLVIDIPRPMENSSSRFSEEEPKSPVTTRLRSLKRLLSREKRINPCSSSSADPEQV